MLTDDAKYLIKKGVTHIDHYAYTERVGKILENDAVNPKPEQLAKARRQALRELTK